MIEGFVAKLMAKAITWFVILGIIAALCGVIYIRGLQLDKAEAEVVSIQKDLTAVIAANQSNQDTIRHLNRDKQIADEAAAKEIAKSAKRDRDLAAIRKELRDAKGSEELMGTYFDDLADRLRTMEQSPADSN